MWVPCTSWTQRPRRASQRRDSQRYRNICSHRFQHRDRWHQWITLQGLTLQIVNVSASTKQISGQISFNYSTLKILLKTEHRNCWALTMSLATHLKDRLNRVINWLVNRPTRLSSSTALLSPSSISMGTIRLTCPALSSDFPGTKELSAPYELSSVSIPFSTTPDSTESVSLL